VYIVTDIGLNYRRRSRQVRSVGSQVRGVSVLVIDAWGRNESVDSIADVGRHGIATSEVVIRLLRRVTLQAAREGGL